MLDQFINLFVGDVWWNIMIRICSSYLLAWLFHRLGRRMAHRMLRPSRFGPLGPRHRPERQATLQGLIDSTISIAAFATATLVTVGQFVSPEALIWIVGLFSVGFGLGARPLISDFLAGVSILFEDTFAVGEKVEILGIEGFIEAVGLRTTQLRAPTGELFIVPNGEVRVVRNFSRGRFSTANIKLNIAAADLAKALPFLDALGKEAVTLLPNLLEPWQVVSESGEMGQQTELTLVTKARFGRAAEMRMRLLTLVQERLAEAGIALAHRE
jgi:small conductance mechanosensitive channel